jgi:transposase InsO family protein
MKYGSRRRSHKYGQTRTTHIHAAVECPDQVGVPDITYVRLKEDFVYLAVIMDVFTRFIRGWRLGPTLEGDLTVLALEPQAALRGAPLSAFVGRDLGCYPRLLMSDVTRLLSAIRGGDRSAASQLLALLSDELRKLAAQKLSHEAPGQTLEKLLLW